MKPAAALQGGGVRFALSAGSARADPFGRALPRVALALEDRVYDGLVLLTLVVLLGILVNRQGRLPGLPRFAVTGLHRSISLLAVAFLAIHVITAVADRFVTIQLVAAVVPFAPSLELLPIERR